MRRIFRNWIGFRKGKSSNLPVLKYGQKGSEDLKDIWKKSGKLINFWKRKS